jgi:hypothetical protein
MKSGLIILVSRCDRCYCRGPSTTAELGKHPAFPAIGHYPCVGGVLKGGLSRLHVTRQHSTWARGGLRHPWYAPGSQMGTAMQHNATARWPGARPAAAYRQPRRIRKVCIAAAWPVFAVQLVLPAWLVRADTMPCNGRSDEASQR